MKDSSDDQLSEVTFEYRKYKLQADVPLMKEKTKRTEEKNRLTHQKKHIQKKVKGVFFFCFN